VMKTWKWSGWTAGGGRDFDLVRVAWAPGNGGKTKVYFGWVCKSKICFGYGVDRRGLRSPNGMIVCVNMFP
jgi:hypothetical protein